MVAEIVGTGRFMVRVRREVGADGQVEVEERHGIMFDERQSVIFV